MRRAVLALLLAGCSYDWAVPRGAASDGGRDVAPADASVADTSDASPVDAAGEPVVDAAPTDSNVGGDGNGLTCMQLLQNAKAARAAAVACLPTMMTPGPCRAETRDWCNCQVVVGDGTSMATMTFISDVNAFFGSNCSSTVSCAACASPTEGDCLVSDAMATTYACYQ